MKTSEGTGMNAEELLTMREKLTLLEDDRPWDNEPDSEEWVDEATGYGCMIKRNKMMMHLCGYVSVPNTPPFEAASYNDDPFSNIEVHGGLTFADVMNDRRVFGFDCGHMSDLSPGFLTLSHTDRLILNDAVYRDWAYVKTEVMSLAHQLKQLEEWHG